MLVLHVHIVHTVRTVRTVRYISTIVTILYILYILYMHVYGTACISVSQGPLAFPYDAIAVLQGSAYSLPNSISNGEIRYQMYKIVNCIKYIGNAEVGDIC